MLDKGSFSWTGYSWEVAARAGKILVVPKFIFRGFSLPPILVAPYTSDKTPLFPAPRGEHLLEWKKLLWVWESDRLQFKTWPLALLGMSHLLSAP